MGSGRRMLDVVLMLVVGVEPTVIDLGDGVEVDTVTVQTNLHRLLLHRDLHKPHNHLLVEDSFVPASLRRATHTLRHQTNQTRRSQRLSLLQQI